ncbi:3-phosphoserine/phosphohydroxythreonine transaminase [Psychrobacter sp. FDAARGOS_221]|uniref:3-phosphoserine/phosphohydroxythreonine transaminase n=1 Tax=Psychrobacter sp. FDAARGOS_221 TaxID=1975705 RepID=UPI000BB53F39|nr:3-phosphoserine/phosphohydroxythreonine transaminase [Psychrobacter sp. FDAARGOS_221]PNK59732.1 3-phosphoserine/phosphohydroxythreonine transaminase [Psychrobacter sp. FDAARGOS_221]
MTDSQSTTAANQVENNQPHRLHNFCAGPASLSTDVLLKAQAEMLDWHGKGVSVMEMSHRSKDYVEVAQKAEQSLRRLMNIPDNYKVLFLQGGATLQFSAIPLNLLDDGQQQGVADYLTTGAWSTKAVKEAKRYADLGLGQINEVASSKANNFVTVPPTSEWQLSEKAQYFHYCANETIHGVQIFEPPQVDAPLVADMSSCILSEPVDVSKFGLIYAGAQKNIGPAGLVIVIVREDLIGKASAWCPSLMDYANQANKDSMLNTPATYSWYLAGLVFEWIEAQGGLEAMAKINRQKAELLYQTIDSTDFYHNNVDPDYRSIMNVPFTLKDDSLDAQFLAEAEKAGLLNLKGHRDVGGMRASIYNAVSLESVQALCDFMIQFAKQHS